MTTPTAASGRRAWFLRPVPGLTCLLISSLLATAPAIAGTGLAADSADQLRSTGPLSDTAASPAQAQPASPERLLFAQDVTRLIDAQANHTQAPAEATGRVQSVMQRALALLGTPYRWGGESPDGGFDCSGLVGYVFRTALGIELPRVSREMASNGEKIDRDALTAGDLVFFSRRGKRVDHVGIYVGNGQFLHAPRTGRDVTLSSLSDGYWSHKYMQARRVPGV